MGEMVDDPKWAVAEAAEGLTNVPSLARVMADTSGALHTSGAPDQILFTLGKAAERAEAEAKAEAEATAEEATAEVGRLRFHPMLTPVAVLAKAGLSGTTAAMLKPGVLVAKAGVTAP